MRIVKRTDNYVYAALSDADMDRASASSDLVRVERGIIGDGYSLRDAVLCDGRFEEVDYPSGWVMQGAVAFRLPADVDEQISAHRDYLF